MYSNRCVTQSASSMTATTTALPNPVQQPLEDHTLDTLAGPSGTAVPQQQQRQGLLERPKRLRRTESLREIFRHADSSESIPSQHNSIYDAQLILSTADDGDNDHDFRKHPDLRSQAKQWLTPPPKPATLPRSPSLENLEEISYFPSPTENSLKYTLQQHQLIPQSKWPMTKLEPIAEQRSIATLRASASLPHLNASPVQVSHIVRPETSFHSVHFNHSRPSPRTQLPEKARMSPHPLHGRRSFSLDDLSSCIPVSARSTCFIHDLSRSVSSASTNSSMSSANPTSLCFVFPLCPARPPPERTPTPPGVPSFGSREALNYAMPPPEQQRSSSLSAQPREARPTQDVRTERQTTSNAISSKIRHLLFGSSPLPTPASLGDSPPSVVQDSSSSRIPLPPGYIARADDGTLVRGRFGARQSGHGAARGLENHPFHRAVIRQGGGAEQQGRGEKSGDTASAVATTAAPPARCTPLSPPASSPEIESSTTTNLVVPSSVSRVNRDEEIRRGLDLDDASRNWNRQAVDDLVAGVNEFIGHGGSQQRTPGGLMSLQQQLPENDYRKKGNGASNGSKFQACWHWFCLCCCELDGEDVDDDDEQAREDMQDLTTGSGGNQRYQHQLGGDGMGLGVGRAGLKVEIGTARMQHLRRTMPYEINLLQ